MFNWSFVSSLPKKWKKHSYLQSKTCQIFWSFWTFYKFKLHPNFVYALHANFLKGPYESGLFVVCSIQLAASNWKNAGDRIQTTNLLCLKQQLYQLPTKKFVLTRKDKIRPISWTSPFSGFGVPTQVVNLSDCRWKNWRQKNKLLKDGNHEIWKREVTSSLTK